MGKFHEEERLEGSGGSKMVQVIRSLGYNADVEVELGTVTAAPPNLRIKLDEMDEELDAEDLIIAEHLTKHTRTISIRKHETEPSLIHFKSSSVDTVMSTEGYTPHSHDISEIELSYLQNDFTFEKLELVFEDELAEGERVIAIRSADGQKYFILDREVDY